MIKVRRNKGFLFASNLRYRETNGRTFSLTVMPVAASYALNIRMHRSNFIGVKKGSLPRIDAAA